MFSLAKIFQKIKKFSENNSRIVIVTILLLIAISVLLPQLARAYNCKATQFGCYIMNGIFQLIKAIAVWPLRGAVAILNWVMGDSFLDIGYTPHENLIIDAGWVPARNFANMFFIVALIIIGIATALQYKDYQAKKALPKLLIVALLINFTPALMATAIETSDTAASFFLQRGRNVTNVSQEVKEEKDIQKDNIINLLEGYLGELDNQSIDWAEVGRVLGSAFFLMIFGLGAAAIYLMFAALFFTRYLILWFLIIVSPIAFLGYIFPYTKKKLWDPWWKQFVNWTIVMLPAAITLFLAQKILARIHEMNIGQPSQGTLGGGGTGANLAEFIGMFLVPLVFLFIGYKVTRKLSSAVSDTIIKGAKAGAGLAMGGAAVAAKKAMPEGAKKRLAKMREYKPPEEEELDEMSAPRRGMAQVGKYAAPARRAVGSWASRRTTSETEQIEEMEEDMEDKDLAEIYSTMKSPTRSNKKKIAGLVEATKRGKVSDLRDMGLSEEEIIKTGQRAMKASPEKFEEITAARPDLGAEMVRRSDFKTREQLGLGEEELEEEKEKLFDKKEQKVLDRKNISEQQDIILKRKFAVENSFKNMDSLDPEALEDEVVMDAMVREGTGQEASKGVQELGREYVDKINKEVNDRGLKWMKKNNLRLLKYMKGNAGQDAGFQTP